MVVVGSAASFISGLGLVTARAVVATVVTGSDTWAASEGKNLMVNRFVLVVGFVVMLIAMELVWKM